MMGGGSTSSTTTVKKLPAYCEPYVVNFLDRSTALSSETYIPYWDTIGAEPTIAPQPTNETAAIDLLSARALAGNETISKAITFIEDVLDGEYLEGTDSFFQATLEFVHDNLVGKFENDVLPLLGASPLVMGDISHENLAQSLASAYGSDWSSRVLAKLYAENYRIGRTIQDRVKAHGLQFASASYKDAETLRLAGLYQRQYNQAVVEDDYRKWLDVEVSRIKKLEILGNAIRGLVGTQYTKTTPLYKPSPVIGFAGGAVSGALLGAQLGAGNPYAIAGGALAGGVLGILGTS